jgi:transposase
MSAAARLPTFLSAISQPRHSPRLPLGGTRYDWLRHPARMELKDRKEFTEPRNSELKTARAWALKETAMALYEYVYERPARKHFRWWYGWAVRSR